MVWDGFRDATTEEWRFCLQTGAFPVTLASLSLHLTWSWKQPILINLYFLCIYLFSTSIKWRNKISIWLWYWYVWRYKYKSFGKRFGVRVMVILGFTAAKRYKMKHWYLKCNSYHSHIWHKLRQHIMWIQRLCLSWTCWRLRGDFVTTWVSLCKQNEEKEIRNWKMQWMIQIPHTTIHQRQLNVSAYSIIYIQF